MAVPGLLLLIILLVIAAAAAIYFHSQLVDIISSQTVRQLVTALFFLAIVIGLPWLGISLLFGETYPVSTHKINDEYSYSQQEYGFVTTSSQGYELNLYRHRFFWFDKKIGSIRLECAGNEDISINLMNGHSNVNRITIKANQATVLDSMVSFDTPFAIARSIIN